MVKRFEVGGLPEVSIAAGHSKRVVKNDARLIPSCGEGIHICPAFPVRAEHIQGQRGAERTFAITPGDFRI